MNFFSPDSKFAQVMTSVGEMMLLNFCWIIASLPLVTMGAANTAMYTVMGQRLRSEDGGTVRPFFRAWRDNLKVSTMFWLAQIFVSGSLGLSLFLTLPGVFRIFTAGLLLLVSLVFSVIYPQMARFRNRPFAILRNALILLILRPGWMLLDLLLFLAPVLLFLIAPMDFLKLGFVWIFFGFSLLFYLSARLMRRILAPLEELSGK